MASDSAVPATLRRSCGSHHQERHVLVEGSLVSSSYDRPNDKSQKSASTKITSWTIRADVVRKLDRSEPAPESAAAPSGETGERKILRSEGGR
jgi:hypothetical protein